MGGVEWMIKAERSTVPQRRRYKPTHSAVPQGQAGPRTKYRVTEGATQAFSINGTPGAWRGRPTYPIQQRYSATRPKGEDGQLGGGVQRKQA